MGLLKGHVQDWLETYGYDLGYDWGNLPPVGYMDKDCAPANTDDSSNNIFGGDTGVDADYTNEELLELEWLENNNPDDGSWGDR